MSETLFEYVPLKLNLGWTCVNNNDGTYMMTKEDDSEYYIPDGNIIVDTPSVSTCTTQGRDAKASHFFVKTFEWKLKDSDTRATYKLNIGQKSSTDDDLYFEPNKSGETLNCGEVTLNFGSPRGSFGSSRTVYKVRLMNGYEFKRDCIWPDEVSKDIRDKGAEVGRKLDGLTDEEKLLATAAADDLKYRLMGEAFLQDVQRECSFDGLA